MRCRTLFTSTLYIVERFSTVKLRLSYAKQVQIWTIEDKNWPSHFRFFPAGEGLLTFTRGLAWARTPDSRLPNGRLPWIDSIWRKHNMSIFRFYFLAIMLIY